MNPNGTEKWREKIATERVDSSAAIGEDGTIYIGCVMQTATPTGYLYAFGRGELRVNANGPYNGYINEDVQFSSTVYGGIPPYTNQWNFGDGHQSDQESPTHNYTHVVIYQVTLTVTDSEGNTSIDNTTATIGYRPPTVSLTKPTRALYIMNTKIRTFYDSHRLPLIIGPITIEATASQEPLGISKVEFYNDDHLESTDTTAPYSWAWNSFSFGKHTITVIAYDTMNNSVSTSLTVWKFF